jgi:UBA-like domain
MSGSAELHAAESTAMHAADDESESIARFVAVTNCPPEQAQFFLQAAGDFERAVTLFYGKQLRPSTALDPAKDV